ncbi:MAG: gliding motility-associated C-terminal domain-containing protein [Bacteroidota bacterium]
MVFVSTATGQIDLALSTLGTYTVTYTSNGLCPNNTTFDVTITTAPSATFSYTGTPYCQDAANPSPTFPLGSSAGTFSSTAGLVFVSTVTGEVDLAATTAGTYTVTNTIAASGACPLVTATSPITITALPVATFSYTGTPYCQNGVNPFPTFSGGGIAGTFSSTAGLVFVSAVTGEVNLALSTAGTYTITNTIAASAGCGIVTATSPITITAQPVATFSYTGTPYCQDAANPSPTFPLGSNAGTFSSTVGLVFVSTATGEVDLAASTAGTYTVTNSIAASAGCGIVTATSPITITALPVATFSYTSTPYCQNGVNPLPTFNGGGVAGTFSSTAGLVFVSAVTGEVNLSLSTAGTYTITNTIAASAGCGIVTATSPITITALPIATFSYTGTPYCPNGINPFPTFSGGGVAGTFSSTAGLSFVSISTGEVDLAISASGTYTVTNTIIAANGCPIVTATSTITINTLDDATFSYPLSTFCQTGANPTPIVTGLAGGTYSSTPGLVFVSVLTGEIDLAGSTLGTYTITYTTNGPCPNTGIFSVTITLLPDATFSYAAPSYCQGIGSNPLPVFPLGSSAGTFSALPAGLVFADANTGEIDIVASAPGVYTITNFIAASGGCPANSATFPLTINAIDDASFTYSLSTYCQTGINPTPIVTGLPGGAFSSTIGLVFVDANTGEIDLAGSVLGTYIITYTTSGPCPNTDVFNVTITLSPSATFSYSGPYCQGGSPDPSPTFSLGSSAGTFSSTPGLVFISAATGQIDLSISTPGTYVVTNTIAASGGCPAAFAINSVTINDLPTISTAGPDQINAATCGLTSANLAANAPIIGTGSWSIFSGAGGSFTLATDPTTIFNGIAGNTYVLIWTISNTPCTASTDSVTITFNQVPTTAAAGLDQTSFATCGLTSVTLAANAPIIGTGNWSIFSGVGGSFVLASDPTTVFSGTAGNTYVLVWTISNVPCTASTDSVTITFNQAPTTAAAGSDQTGSSTCGLISVPLAANTPIIGAGNWSVFSGVGGSFVLASDPTTVFTGTAGSTYVLIWTITNAPCVSTDSVTITFNVFPTVVTNNPVAVCSPATVDITAAAVTLGSTVSLSFTYFTDALAITPYLTPATAVAGTYYIVGATLAGCTDTTAVVVTVNSSPDVTATGINLTCFNVCNGSAIATVVGGTPDFTYIWSSGPSITKTSATDTITGLCISGYTVTVTDANGCSDTDSVTLTQPTQIVPNVTTGNISCLGVCDGLSESSPSGGTAPYTFAWNTGSVDTLITDLCPGTYTVIVTDALGCTISLPDTIVQAAAVLSNAIITNATCGLCDGQVVLAPSGGIAPYTFLWGNGQTSNTETNLCAGLYSVNITDSAGCSSSYSIPISNPGGPTSATITSTNISCFGLSDGAVTAVTPAGGTPPYSYLWIQGGETTSTLSNLGAGVYYVQIADSVGCSLIDSVTITEPTQVVVNQFITASTCGLCDGSLSVAPSGGAAPYTVVWSTGSVLDTITSLCPGFYSVQITDFVGCAQSIVMPLNSLNAPTLTTSSVQLLCNGACNATATIVAAGGILPYTYLWNDPGAQTTDVATALCAGTYFVQVTGGGCVSFASVEITDPAPIGFSLANSVDPLCNGNNNGSVAVIPFGGTLPYTFSWTGSGSVSDTASGLSAGVYVVTVTDANGCTSSQSNTLANPDSLTISNVPTPASCNTIADGAIDVTVGGGTPGYTYQWSGGSALTTQDLTGILIGSYDITVTDTNGCTITDNIIITSTVTVNAVAGNDTAFCEPGTMLLSAAGSSANAINYQWFQIPTNTLVGSIVDVSVTPAVGVTDYYVIVDNGAGCAHNDTISVTVNALPVANAGADVTILATTTTVLGGNPTGPVGATYAWDPILGLDNGTNSNPVANPTVTTTYTVTVTSAEGCKSNDIVIVTVVANITFANGISPNADGANDEWIIDNIELFPKSVVEVYNRWGELLFQSTGYTEKWKGVFKGQLLPVGTYYYIINLNDPFFPDVLTGPITILR